MSSTTSSNIYSSFPQTREFAKLFAALAGAQAKFPVVAKNSENPAFRGAKYADLADIVKQISPILSEWGLAVIQFPTQDNDGRPSLTTYLTHESGQYLVHEMPMFPTKNDPQGQGSAITYARRYAYCAVLGVVADVDDDGNRAVEASSPRQTVQEQSKAEEYITAMGEAKKLKELEGDGKYTALLREMAVSEGYSGVGEWAKIDAPAVIETVTSYLGILADLQKQDAAEMAGGDKPPATRRPRRAKVGSAVEADPAALGDPDAAAEAALAARRVVEQFPGTEEVSDDEE